MNNLLIQQYGKYKRQQLDENPYSCLLDTSIDINPHQVDAFCAAVKALKTGGIILADEVGLGKTIEAGLVIKYVIKTGAKKILISLPASLRKQWEVELLEKFGFPEETIKILDRQAINYDPLGIVDYWLKDSQKVSIALTSYDFSSKLMKKYPTVKWDFVVIDEAHNMRNIFHGTKRAKRLYEQTHNIPKILLTATPLQNSLSDLHGLVSFIDPRIFGTEKAFNKQYKEDNNYAELKQNLAPVLYRTLRKDVSKYMQFANRVSRTFDFELSYDEAALYMRVNNFLKRDYLYSLPTANRNLLTLVIRKLLASSSFALIETFEVILDRLQKLLEGTKSKDAQEGFELFWNYLDDDYNIVNQIGYAMSLREPQKEALQYLDAISSSCDYKRNTLDEIEAIATANCEDKHTIKVDDNFKFPSFCFDMATGIGKTRLMGAAIYYLYKTKGYKHFFILAPGNTIYDKLRKESNPAHPKYIFKGLEAEMGRPKVYDGENYVRYPARFVQGEIEIEKTSEIQLFIFNIGKIFNSKTDTTFKFHKYQETLGSSFADVLAKFDDLVICMDEAHRYYAPASMKAISYLKPILGLEFTATPKSHSNVIYSYDLAKGAGKYLKIPVVMGRTNTGGYSAEDIEEMKIRDGLTLHENRKKVVYQYCLDNNLDYVKPIVLIACKDTEHAKKIRAMIDSDSFNNGRYRGKVIEIHSNMKGEETEENIRKLLSIESAQNPVEIVLHVYKLKEGWDVNNLFTIIPLNAAKSDILALQTIGRGLRLPFGVITGNEAIDTLDIVAFV